jgi:hypothetical protein
VQGEPRRSVTVDGFIVATEEMRRSAGGHSCSTACGRGEKVGGYGESSLACARLNRSRVSHVVIPGH